MSTAPPNRLFTRIWPEPLRVGFVGPGMLDAACPGQVFTSPTPDQMVARLDAGATCSSLGGEECRPIQEQQWRHALEGDRRRPLEESKGQVRYALLPL